jgi:hypothetical protein
LLGSKTHMKRLDAANVAFYGAQREVTLSACAGRRFEPRR